MKKKYFNEKFVSKIEKKIFFVHWSGQCINGLNGELKCKFNAGIFRMLEQQSSLAISRLDCFRAHLTGPYFGPTTVERVSTARH